MKKIIASVIIFTLLCTSLFGCSGSKKYKLIDVPENIQIDTESLSEDPANLLNDDEAFPLFVAEPESGVFAYVASVPDGIYIKYDGRIQYFNWKFVPAIAKPDIHVFDYNGDGLEDIAVTILTDVGETNYNEELHLLINHEENLEDCPYMKARCTTDCKGILTFAQNKSNDDSYFFYINGQRQKELTLKGKGQSYGLYLDAVQDYTLGDTITLEVTPGIIFESNPVPDYSIAKFRAELSYSGGVFSVVNPSVEY